MGKGHNSHVKTAPELVPHNSIHKKLHQNRLRTLLPFCSNPILYINKDMLSSIKTISIHCSQTDPSAVISPSRCLQYQRDVVQSGLIDNISESRDSDVTFTDVFVAIEVAA